MNRRNVVITEDELILIRHAVKEWLRVDKFEPLGNQDLVDEMESLLNSLPLPDHEMEIEE